VIWQLRDRRLDFQSRARVMGILNITPDSFYDGGRDRDLAAAVDRGLGLVAAGADILDVGGESSRPPVYGTMQVLSAAEECARVLPVIDGLRRHTSVPISVDTVKAEVARRALDLGADIINDISAMRDDPAMLSLVARAGVPVVLMHRRGTSHTMQRNTVYADLVGEVTGFLRQRIAVAGAAGIAADRIAIDPGLGFGKSVAGNLELVRRLDALVALGHPVLVGASRKAFIWRTLGLSPAEALEGSLAVATLCLASGAHLLRVHDVAATVRIIRMAEAVLGSAASAARAAGRAP
jgi:dihydropteroate synthase